MCMRFYTMTPATLSRNGARTLAHSRSPLRTSALSLLNWGRQFESEGGESEHSPLQCRLCPAHRDCAQAASAELGKYVSDF